ncbi:MAG: hypothetical protein J2P37_35920 [Ktedonobacteraceae bacterium]|nr:hypothetical protein [Ktedonobacteraceae bacterium]
MDSRSTFVSFLRQPSTLAELQAGDQVFAREEVQPFLAALRQIPSNDQRDATLRDLVPLLPEIDSFHAGMLALLCGILVEHGGTVSNPLVDAIMELMVRQLTQMRDAIRADEKLNPDERFQRFPEASRAQASLPFTLPAVMAMLCRDKEARKAWQRRQDVIQLVGELEDANQVPFFLKRTLTLLDDKKLLVVDQQNRRAFLAHLVGVQDNMFHCFALLQHALLEYAGPGYLDARPTNPLAVRYAQNNNLTQQDYIDAQNIIEERRFVFHYPGGLWVPGDASFSELPVFRGLPFLLIANKDTVSAPQTIWDPTNWYPVLHQELEASIDIVRELRGEEAELWTALASLTKETQ